MGIERSLFKIVINILKILQLSQDSVARPVGLLSAGGTTPTPLSHTRILFHPPPPPGPQRGSYPRPERGEPSVQLPAARPGDNLRPASISHHFSFWSSHHLGPRPISRLPSLTPSSLVSHLTLGFSLLVFHLSSLIPHLTSSRSCYG